MAEIALLAAGTALTAGGQVAGGVQARQQAETQAANELAIADFEAQQLTASAQNERAVAAVAAKEKRREKELLISRQIAVAAASGAGVINPTVLDLIEDAEVRGEILAGTETFKGEQRARSILDRRDARTASASARARTLRKGGKAAFTQSLFKAAGTVLSGASAAAGAGAFGGSGAGSTVEGPLGFKTTTRFG